MRAFVIGFLLFCAFALVARWFYVCEIRGLCVPAPEPQPRPLTLALMQGDSAVADEFQQFAFAKNSPEPILTENNRVFLETVFAWMKAFPEWHLRITGRQLKSETDRPVGMYDYLALARAAAVRDSLVGLGADAAQMDLDFEFLPDSIGLREPLAFHAVRADSTHVHVPFTFEDMTFTDRHFTDGGELFQPASSFFRYADSLGHWQVGRTGVALQIVAHADRHALPPHVAQPPADEEALYAYTHEYGLRRARQVAHFLLDYALELPAGIDSPGHRQPMADPEDPLQQLKNRRINLRIVADTVSVVTEQ